MCKATKQVWKKAESHEQEMRDAIRDAHRHGEGRHAKYLTRTYLRSFDSRLVATREAYDQMKPHLRPPVGELPSIAAGLSAWHGTSEKVGVFVRPKKHDLYDFRIVMSFGIENRALQYLVRNCIKSQVDLHPAQFAVTGGRTKAIKRVQEALATGHTHVVQWDIKDCFNSFNADKLNEFIPLPKEVIDRVISTKHFSLIDKSWFAIQPGEKLDEELFTEARQGIAQGSAISSLVADVALAPVVEHVSKLGGAVVAYADNLLLTAKTDCEMVTTNEALCMFLNKHPAGPLWLNDPLECAPGEDFEFLGYKLRAQGTDFTAEPSERNLLGFEARFEKQLKQLKAETEPNTRKKLVKSLRCRVFSWASAFSLWSGAEHFCKQHLALVK